MAKEFLSPKIRISETDRTFETTSIGATTAGVVGESKKGPAFSPMLVNSFDEFKTFFGDKDPTKFKDTQIVKYEGSYIAESFLAQSNQLFFTRILGLSGYDKGPAYSLVTIGAPDTESITEEQNNDYELGWYIDSQDLFRYHDTSEDINGNEFTLKAKLIEFIENKLSSEFGFEYDIKESDITDGFQQFFDYPNGPWTNMVNILAVGKDIAATGWSDRYELDTTLNPFTGSTQNNTISDKYIYKWVDNWFRYFPNEDKYYGIDLQIYNMTAAQDTLTNDDVDDENTGLIGNDKGKIKIKIKSYSALVKPEYHKKVAATFRSRGLYIADELFYDINQDPDSGGTVTVQNGSNIENDVFNDFVLSGITEQNGDTFAKNISLDKRKNNFAKNKLGVTNFDKGSELYVEEVYYNFLYWGTAAGKIRGLDPEIYKFENWNDYKSQFTTPETPYIVSDLIGGEAQELFKLISISDGYEGNFEAKISIANINLQSRTFDLYVRDYNDRDASPVYLERYFNLTMRPNSDNFIGKRIGTADGIYPLVSNYITVEMAEDAPIEAVPAGFKGYVGRKDTDMGVFAPHIEMKTQYYNRGEEIVQKSPIAQPVLSSGDKVKKTFLGFSDKVGFDEDILKFKGDNISNGIDSRDFTNGFHLDANADTSKFSVGESGFTDVQDILSNPQHPYNDVGTRKFTVLFAGGFDGWDMFRKSRTNTDEYQIGNFGFDNGGFDTFIHEQFKTLFGTSDFYAYLEGIKTFQNPETVNINIMATPGIDVFNNQSLVSEVQELVEEERKDVFYIPTLPDIKILDNNDPTDSSQFYYPEDVTALLDSKGYDSSYMAVYYPWIQKRDNRNNQNVFLPPTAEIFRQIAFTDKVEDPWFAYAGYNRGVLNAIRTRDINISESVRDLLYQSNINPIPTFSDVGPIIFGNINLQQEESMLNRVNIRRLLIQAQSLIKNVGKRLLFDPNDDTVEDEFESQVNPILANIANERGLIDFRVQVDSNAEELDRRTLSGKIFLQPTPALENMELEFIVSDSGESFS